MCLVEQALVPSEWPRSRPTESCDQSGCLGLRMRLRSTSTMADGTFSSIVERSLSQASPIGRQRSSAGSPAIGQIAGVHGLYREVVRGGYPHQDVVVRKQIERQVEILPDSEHRERGAGRAVDDRPPALCHLPLASSPPRPLRSACGRQV